MKKKVNKPIEHKKEYKKKKKQAFLSTCALVGVVWLVLLIIKIVTAFDSGDTFADVSQSILNSVFDNVLGVLPPIIVIDLVLEYFQQDKIFEEMTEQITGTIMSKPEVIASFEKEAQKRFLDATVLSLVDQDEDECEVALGAVEPYISDKFDIRKDFTYYLEIRDCDNIEGFDNDKYMLMCENLSYELFYVVSEPICDTVHMGFFVENAALDKVLREENVNYIMREGLDIAAEDFSIIREKSKDAAELQKYIDKLLAPQLYIDDEMWMIQNIIVSDNSIDIEFCGPDKKKQSGVVKSNKISLYFHMPQLKQNTSFLASITQPTYSPIIRLSYPEEKYDIKNYLFFNKTFGPSAEKAEQGVGSRNIQIKDKWVHPMSGVVFLINHK